MFDIDSKALRLIEAISAWYTWYTSIFIESHRQCVKFYEQHYIRDEWMAYRNKLMVTAVISTQANA